jgi:ubiquinone/menaquinone biosynthesis C-methylase UbiE
MPREKTMTTRLPNTSEEGAVFGSANVAEEWQRRKAQRAKVNTFADEMMLDLANLRAGSRVLDVAAGTGEQTIRAAQRVGPSGYVLATDVSASMLNLAAEAIRDARLSNVETRVMDAANIDLEADSFDAVICRQGLMLFPERGKALFGMRRVVKPGSRVVALVWSSAEKNPYHALPLAIARRVGNIPSPGPEVPGMFTLGEPSILEALFRTAGFLEVLIKAVPVQRRFASAAEAAKAMHAPILQQLTAKLSDSEREKARVEIEQEFSRFQGPNGVEFPSELLIAVGTK